MTINTPPPSPELIQLSQHRNQIHSIKPVTFLRRLFTGMLKSENHNHKNVPPWHVSSSKRRATTYLGMTTNARSRNVQKIHYHDQNTLPMVPTLCQTTPVHIPIPYAFQICCRPSHLLLDLTSGYASSNTDLRLIFLQFFCSFARTTYVAHLVLPNISVKISGEGCELISSWCSFFFCQPVFHTFPLTCNHWLNHILNSLKSKFFP